jgi:putative ABC transport system permease protein
VRNDLAFAIRTLLRQPALTLPAIATLAVGIGATTAIFSTVNATLFRPLPYLRPQELRVLGTTVTDGRVTTGRIAPIEVARLQDPSLSIVAAAAITPTFDASLVTRDGTSIPLSVCAVGEGFFPLLGLPMSAGREFTHDEHVVTAGNGPPPSAILSYRLWRDAFGRDAHILGTSIHVLEFPDAITVVGIAAPELDIPHHTDMWVNQRIDPTNQSHSFDGYVRVRPSTTPQRLQTELAGVMGRLAHEFPAIDKVRVYTVKTLVEAIVGDLGPTLVLMLSATALLLLLACANVTSLLLTSATSRTREIAVRVALGATRGRIVRQLLTESAVLASVGTVAGVSVAYVGIRLLLWYSASNLPRLDAVPFDGRVLLFAFAALLTTTVLVGFAPTLRLATTNVATLMNDSGRSATSGRAQQRLLMLLVVAEIALAIVLVTGAGWLVRSFMNLEHTDPGFVAEGRLAVDVLVPYAKYNSPERVLAWSQQVTERVKAIGGVRSVGSSPAFPLHAGRNNVGVTYVLFQGETADPDHPRSSRYHAVSPDFFDAMGIRLLAGRGFTADDRQGTGPVAIVSQSFARRYLAGRNPLTTLFSFGYPTIDPKSLRPIVGVVDDVKYASLAEVPTPTVYLAQAQWPYWQMTIVVTTALRDSATMTSAVRAAMQAVDPQLLLRFETVPHIVASSLELQRLGLTLMVLFAVAALGLAAIGIYGVIAYASAQRRSEVAIRMALGATPSGVFWLLVKQGRTFAMLGTLLGVGGALVVGRIARSQLYEVRASDPLVLVSASAMVLVIAAVAIVVPARRSAAISPAGALRLG